MAKRAIGFEMAVSYFSRTRKLTLEREYGWSYLELEELLIEVDYLVICAPYTLETHHLLNRDRLLMMKSCAYLINIGRGAIIDEQALIEVLQAGHLSGAALDVYEDEPVIPKALREMRHVTLSPHLGSATVDARQGMSRLALDAGVQALLRR